MILFKDNFEWLKNKDGSYKLDRYGRRRYNITDGKTEMTYPLTLQQSFNRDTMFFGGWKPYLFVDFILVSHQFNPTPYFTTNQDRKTIQDKVWELHNQGWGYTKIHHYLVDNGFKVGKSRTVVDSMIKKRIMREFILNQPIILEEYKDIRLGVLKN